MSEKFKKITSESLHKNPYWEYRKDTYKIGNSNTFDYFYVNNKGSTFIIAKDEDKFVLVEQYRYLNRKNSLEFPGGSLIDGLSQESNAEKELLEETGYQTKKLEHIGSFNPYNGVSNEICELFFTENLILSVPSPDKTELIKMRLLTEKEIDSKIVSGEIWDGMTLAAWTLFKLKKGTK